MNDKTLGAYKRTTPDPDETTGEALARLQAEMTRLLDEADAELRDEADGGVAAALIEKEAEQNDAADFATAEFARHAESGGVGMRKDAGDPNTWCVAYENPGWRVGIRSDIEMARDGWAPVRECPDPDDHILARDYAAMSDRATAWQKRAEKAEKERDAAQHVLEEHRCGEQAERAYRRAVAAEARPLTPDAITDEMVERARNAPSLDGRLSPTPRLVREMLTAALPMAPDAMTAREHLNAAWEAAHVPADGIIPEGRMFLDRGSAGVVVVGAAGHDLESRGSSWERRLVDPPAPARPEGAEEIERLLMDADRDGGEVYRTDGYTRLADYLAEGLSKGGVRVVGEERS